MDKLNWFTVSKSLKFRPENEKENNLEICHLNGYHGFYGRSTNDPNVFEEENILDRINGIKNVISILKKLEFVVDDQNIGWLSFGRHINYAWEKNPLAEKIRLAAREIFKNTDILVIIGYSFPPFNKEIDQELFNELRNKKTKIFYQDPNASEEFISILTKNFDTEVKCIKDKLDHFYLPYDY